jgi:hypothetical protein
MYIRYDEVVRPSVLSVMRYDQLVHWPTSYELEKARSQGDKGHFRSSSIPIPESHVQNVAQQVRFLVNDSPVLYGKFGGFFYHIFQKNTKLTLRSTFGDLRSQLRTNYAELDWDTLDFENLFLDVGFEFIQSNAEDKVTMLLDSDAMRAFSKTTGATSVDLDLYCFTKDVAGFRAPMKTPLVINGLYYIAAYMKEKELTYTHKSIKGMLSIFY